MNTAQTTLYASWLLTSAFAFADCPADPAYSHPSLFSANILFPVAIPRHPKSRLCIMKGALPRVLVKSAEGVIFWIARS
jgi:hypothetical protein